LLNENSKRIKINPQNEKQKLLKEQSPPEELRNVDKNELFKQLRKLISLTRKRRKSSYP